MGKPYNHQYHFKGYGTTIGRMICGHCSQPIDNQRHDWMSYNKSHPVDDWRYHTFHRQCRQDQSGWKEIEVAEARQEETNRCFKSDVEALMVKYKIEDGRRLKVWVEEAFGLEPEYY